MTPSLPQRVRASGLLPDAGLVVAVSGGPDSVALTRAIATARRPGSPLLLAHLNHQLRGDEGDGDEAFVVALHATMHAEDNAVFLTTHRLDVHAIALAESGNLEAVARRERYAWLAAVARVHGLACVATGHTANDQAETVLHRLLRGAGLDGLRGIAASRSLGEGVTLVRPLLAATREEVVAYLASVGQTCRHDASNDDRTRTRNRIRHALLPLLRREYNPRVDEALARLAVQAGEAAAAEEALAAALLHRAERPRAGDWVVFDAAMLGAELRVARGALRLVWRREGWPLAAMGFAQYERVAALAAEQSGAHDLPGGVRVERTGSVLRLRRDNA